MARCPKIPMQEPQEFTRGEIGIQVDLHFNSDSVTSGDLSESLSVSTGRVATALKGLEKKDSLFAEQIYPINEGSMY